VTRPAPQEGMRRVRVRAPSGRLASVDVPLQTRDELMSAIRESARTGAISQRERDRMMSEAARLNPDGTAPRDSQGAAQAGQRPGQRSGQRAGRASRSGTPESGRFRR
jgi:hypothetical protein